jgi:tRNA (guanine37-N1)-methyltransferase
MPETEPKLHISIITLFPDIFDNHLKHLPISRALEKKLVQIDFINLRDFAVDKRGTVDSPPYGGGPGMILQPEPIFNAVSFAVNRYKDLLTGVDKDKSNKSEDLPGDMLGKDGSDKKLSKIIFLTPRGKTYDQKKALELSQVDYLIIVCGRYEGMDQRVVDYFTNIADLSGQTADYRQNNPPINPTDTMNELIAEEVSIGNYVLSGGEIPSMAIVESVVRLLPGAIDNPEALTNESFNPSRPSQVEHPQYSRPEEWQGLKVPEVLVSGHHAKIEKWKGLA